MKFIIIFCVFSFALARPQSDDDLKDILKRIKAILQTDEGLQEVKTYISILQAPEVEIDLIKSYVSYTDDATLHQLINDLLSGLDDSEVDVTNDELADLVRKARAIIETDEGFQEVKSYFANLETTNPIVYGIKTFVLYSSEDYVKQLITDLLSGV